MNAVIIGGAGAMGLIVGSRLAQQGHHVSLLDVNRPAIETINRDGARITNKGGIEEIITSVRATHDAASIGPVDLAVVFTKCYWTQEAVQNALPCIGPDTTVLSLQNGWGNYDVISALVPARQVMVGVTYISGTMLAPGHARQVGNPVAYVGRVEQPADNLVNIIANALTQAGITTTPSDDILTEVFNKLTINITTLPTSALLGLQAHQLIENEGTIRVMDDLLGEMVAVMQARGVVIDFAERREAIHNLLKNAVGARGSMLQDVEAKRRTEIDVINGAIVQMGQQAGIPTPVNNTMVQLIKALEKKE